MGRPLDAEAALERAAQVAALADPLRLQMVSILARGDHAAGLDGLAAQLQVDRRRVDATLTTLQHAGLVTNEPAAYPTLTADAWVRFGSLLGGQRQLAAVSARSELPSPISRIVDDLAYRFDTTFSRETVDRYVRECYELLSARATVTTYLATLTSRFATDRLSALATTRGLTPRTTPEVLFVCTENAGRSQMAGAVLRHVAGDQVHVRSAGSAPAAQVELAIVEALDEIGVSMPMEFPKPLTDEVVQASDYVITMGCGDACPVYPGRRYMEWTLADPIGRPRAFVRCVRDEVVARVGVLVADMGLTGVRSLPSVIR
jgi:protein-tyrosine-phosphatase